MKTAKEMRELTRKTNPINQYFEKRYAPEIERLAEKGHDTITIEIDTMPFKQSRPVICETIKDYVESFGYRTNIPAGSKKIHIYW